MNIHLFFWIDTKQIQKLAETLWEKARVLSCIVPAEDAPTFLSGTTFYGSVRLSGSLPVVAQDLIPGSKLLHIAFDHILERTHG